MRGFSDDEFVELSHKKGLKIFIWNIDDPDLKIARVGQANEKISKNL